eukprot:CAMPEP_0201542768 /NCGR_PEP_ID=MMETSP0161_2-20130828/72214_1 /ASSEMBLY_ACC=CAM_ASM_000251 /TAXON_ID=180227 /ORGANISM="Neoparamoeba aestuarina, Strain SoJaBio B1-5/56/2" /LENGTH=263 /DNA_ID=CAMNT_0047950447 /DNA_START=621 /DNA_END=1409 /DNA_ORIENTATION=-
MEQIPRGAETVRERGREEERKLSFNEKRKSYESGREVVLPPLSLPVAGDQKGGGVTVRGGRRCFDGCLGEIAKKFEKDVFPEFCKSKHFFECQQEFKQLYPKRSFRKITKNKEEEESLTSSVGLTTSPSTSPLLTPVPFEECVDELPPLYGYCFVSVGDCKAFAFSQKKRMFMDITCGNRLTSRDPTDPGGRLGPSSTNGKMEESGVLPDLRNLSLYFHEFEEGDLLLLMSDGVHDNLDPQILGYSPLSFGIPCESWDVLGEW